MLHYNSSPAHWLITQKTLPTRKTVASVREVSAVTVLAAGHLDARVTIRTGPSGLTTKKRCFFQTEVLNIINVLTTNL